MRWSWLAGLAAAGLLLAVGGWGQRPAATAVGLALLAAIAFLTQVKRTRRAGGAAVYFVGSTVAAVLGIAWLARWEGWLSFGAAGLLIFGGLGFVRAPRDPAPRPTTRPTTDHWSAFSAGEDPTDDEFPASLGQ